MKKHTQAAATHVNANGNAMEAPQTTSMTIVKHEQDGTIPEGPAAQPAETKVRSLEQNIDLIEDLGRLVTQRYNLSASIDALDAFKFSRSPEGLPEEQPHSTCEITIESQNRNKFQLSNPIVLERFAKRLSAEFLIRLGEVDSMIVLPPAA